MATSPTTETHMSTVGGGGLECDAYLFDLGDKGLRVEDFFHPDFTKCPDPAVFMVRFTDRATNGAGPTVRFRCADCAAAAAAEFGDDATLTLLSRR